MLLWLVFVYRGTRSRRTDDSLGNLPYMFFYSALPIPLFYAVGLACRTEPNFGIADCRRVWVVHLWVEDFLELFSTIMVSSTRGRLLGECLWQKSQRQANGDPP